MALKTEARKPLYAVVGAGDLAVENIKELPTQVVAQATTILPKTTAFVAGTRGKVFELPMLVTTKATELTGVAFGVYGDLAERGQKLVSSIRRSSATQQAEASVKVAKAQAKAATTSATKAAKATAKAVENAAEKIG